jgi:adenylate cyclase
VSDPQPYRRRPLETPSDARRWPTYVGITSLLLFIIVALAGGIIWYNSRKSSELAIADAERLMKEADDKIIDRIRLLYDPMYAIVGIASLVPDLTTPASAENASAKALLLRALRIYPQILSLYVGFDNGAFFMVTHLAGGKAADLRKALLAPADAVFAEEIITPEAGGRNIARWVFLAEDGAEVGRRDPAPPFDPRQRPWYAAAKQTEVVEHSDLYVFASNGESGFTLSRSFKGPTPGVMGADLAAVDLANFLKQQRITPGSTAFIFTKAGEVVALPDQDRIVKALALHADGENRAVLPQIAKLNDPVIEGLVAAYQDHQMGGTRVYDVAGRSYIARVVDIPPRYGRDQLLAIAVPVDEIEQPITDIRNDTLLYSVAFLVFAMPLYVTLVVIWIDRRLDRRAPRQRFRDDE